MNRQDAIMSIEMCVFLFMMLVAGNFVPEGIARMAVGVGNIGAFIVIIFIQEYGIRLVVSKWDYLRCETVFVDGSETVLRFFVKNKVTIESDTNPKQYMTTFTVVPLNVRSYGKVEAVQFFTGPKPFEKRVNLRPGDCVYQGFQVPHPQAASCFIEEKVTGGVDVYRGAPIPIFDLARGNNDRGEMPIDFNELVQAAKVKPLVSDNPGHTESSSAQMSVDVLPELSQVRMERDTYRTKFLAERKLRQQAEDMHMHVRNQLNSVLAILAEKSMSAAVEVWSLIENFRDLETAGKALGTKGKETAKLVGYAVGLAALVSFFYFNPNIVREFLSWLGPLENKFYLLLIFVIIGGVSYYIRKRRK